ncbi:MAG: DoxX family protein [Chitinophagales bacterium]
MKISKERAWFMLLLLIRIWLGYRLIGASYSSVVDIIFHPKERAFFEKWFGQELHFPMPLLMAFLAKGAELLGGFLLLIGLFTRFGASLIAFTMLIATLVANLGENWNIDGGFTISYFLFAWIFILNGGGRFSMDAILKSFKMKKADYQIESFPANRAV